jgi:hypothetical protein
LDPFFRRQKIMEDIEMQSKPTKSFTEMDEGGDEKD